MLCVCFIFNIKNWKEAFVIFIQTQWVCLCFEMVRGEMYCLDALREIRIQFQARVLLTPLSPLTFNLYLGGVNE